MEETSETGYRMKRQDGGGSYGAETEGQMGIETCTSNLIFQMDMQ